MFYFAQKLINSNATTSHNKATNITLFTFIQHITPQTPLSTHFPSHPSPLHASSPPSHPKTSHSPSRSTYPARISAVIGSSCTQSSQCQIRACSDAFALMAVRLTAFMLWIRSAGCPLSTTLKASECCLPVTAFIKRWCFVLTISLWGWTFSFSLLVLMPVRLVVVAGVRVCAIVIFIFPWFFTWFFPLWVFTFRAVLFIFIFPFKVFCHWKIWSQGLQFSKSSVKSHW